jgi:ribosomal protein S18 acetylase RimI-like enzyme/DNA-binding MarR family transcriptional regulator
VRAYRREMTAMDLIRDLRELALGSHMKRLLDRTDRGISNVYKELGINFEARWFSLLYLLSKSSPMTVTGTAQCLGFTHPAVNKLAAEMMSKGLLTSSVSKEDRRKRMLRLTKKGREIASFLEPVWEDIRRVIQELLEASNHNLLLAIEDFERLLDDEDIYDRIFERLRPRLLREIEILDYSPTYGEKFKTLNHRWLTKHFRVENHDKEILNDPVGKIIKTGGAVLFARTKNRIVGTCALIQHRGGVFELSKMAVAEDARRRSVGTALTLAAIQKAGAAGADDLFLETHPTLIAARRLYESLGFERVEHSPLPKRYRRRRIVMRLRIPRQAKGKESG